LSQDSYFKRSKQTTEELSFDDPEEDGKQEQVCWLFCLFSFFLSLMIVVIGIMPKLCWMRKKISMKKLEKMKRRKVDFLFFSLFFR
jgi:uncharacterized Tic20 family protein